MHVRIVSSRRSAEEMKTVKSTKTNKSTRKTSGGATRVSKAKKTGTSPPAKSSSTTSTNNVYAKQHHIAEKRIRRVSYVNSEDDDEDYSTAKRARTENATDVGTTATPAEPMTFTASLTNTPITTGRRVMARRSSSLNLVASILNSTDFDALFGDGPDADNVGTDTAATAITRSETSGPASFSNLPFSLPNLENDPSDEDQDQDEMSDLSDSSTCTLSDRNVDNISPIPTGRRSSYAPSSSLLEMLSASTGTGAGLCTTLVAPSAEGDMYQSLSYYEKLKIHHMNLLSELTETTALLDLYQRHIVENH